MSGSSSLMLGISGSEPPGDELTAHGLTLDSVQRAIATIVGGALDAGWSIACGGDLRPGGLTHTLLEVARDRAVGPERVTSWLAWPLWRDLNSEDLAQLSEVATVIQCRRPDGAPESLPPPAERSPNDRLLAADSLRLMRWDMTAALAARVVIGGRVAGQAGLVPGIVEEAALAVLHGVPLYAAGGLGGAARVVVEGLALAPPDELTLGYQLAHTDGYRELWEHALANGQAYDPLVALFTSTTNGLGNGLSPADNRRLAETHDLAEIVRLITIGLDRVARQHHHQEV